jgi:hypothetical protein
MPTVGVTSQSRGNGNQGVTSQPSNHSKLNCSKRDLTSQLGDNENEIGYTHKCVTHILCEMFTNDVSDYKNLLIKK